ncbi:hypothetical protein AAJ76_230003, partial [Vairimorpha ceranae]
FMPAVFNNYGYFFRIGYLLLVAIFYRSRGKKKLAQGQRNL